MAGRIPDEVIERILNETDIAGVVSRYVRLERKGGNLIGLCPFHSEKTATFSVAPAKRIFYCFGCHKGGNVIQFFSEIEQMTFSEAVQILAGEAGISLEHDDGEAYQAKKKAEQRMREVLLESARFYFRTLSVQEGNEAKKYLLNRGVREAAQRRFGLGFAPKGRDRLVRHLLEKGCSVQEAVDAGICRRDSNGTLTDVFRDRLMIPIFDLTGQIVAFSSRSIDGERAAYIEFPETVLYKSGQHLFGLNLAKQRKGEAFIVTEGCFDVIALHAAGFQTAVALLGTTMSARQAQLLAQMERPVILCLDSDQDGVTATLQALVLLRERQIDVSVVTVPEYKDPDLYIQAYGAARFKALLETKADELDYKLDLAEKRARSEDGVFDRSKYRDEATDMLAAEANTVVRELKAVQVARVLNTSHLMLQEEVERKRRMIKKPQI